MFVVDDVYALVQDPATNRKEVEDPPLLKELMYLELEDHPSSGGHGWFVPQRIIELPHLFNLTFEDYFLDYFEDVF